MLGSGPMSLIKRSMVGSVFLAATILTLAMVAAAVGCGGEDGTPTRPGRPAATPADPANTSSLRVPTPTVGIFSAPVNPIWYVPPALEEQIFTSTVIARASLLSVSAAVEEVESGPGVAPTYHAIQELSFTVHEYLKGSGPPELVVVVRSDHNHLSEEDAREVAEYRVSTRNTTWDDREGLLFLRQLRPAYEVSTESSGGNSTRSAHQTLAFTQSNFVVQSEWDYTVDTLAGPGCPPASREVPRATRAVRTQRSRAGT